MAKHKAKHKAKGNGIRVALWIVCSAALLIGCFFLGRDVYEGYRANQVQDETSALYAGSPEIKRPSSSIQAASAQEANREEQEEKPSALEAAAFSEGTDEEALPEIHEDFLALYEQNVHIVGWLKLGEKIDYPVVQYDNDYYLHHDFRGRADSNGTLFLNQVNSVIPRDDVLLIHGHNMKSGAMFGKLMQYEQEEYLRQYPLVTFRTIYDAEDVVYVPVAAFNASMVKTDPAYFDIMWILFDKDEEGRAEYQAYLDALKEKSLWQTPFDVTPEDKLLMLVTCSYYHDNGRFMLICRMLRDGETPESVWEAWSGEAVQEPK